MSPAASRDARLTEEEREALSDYERGFVGGLWAYSWWKDGAAYVGTTGTTYARAVRRFLEEGQRVGS